MAYNNFIPTIWSETFLHECEQASVYLDDCYTEFQGEIKKRGSEIIFSNVGTPTVTIKDRDDANEDLPPVETVPDSAFKMVIRRLALYNYMVGDVDKVQSQVDVMKRLMHKQALSVAQQFDYYVAQNAMHSNAKKLFAADQLITAGTTVSGTSLNVLDAIDKAEEALRDNNVPDGEQLVLNCSNRFFTLLRANMRTLSTDNKDLLEKGQLRLASGIIVKRSSACPKSTSGATDYIMLRTRNAIGFAKQMEEQIPYKPEAKLADAIKGGVLFDTDLMCPKEMIVLNVKYA